MALITSPATLPRRLILSIQGPQRSGRTHLGLTAPGPVIYLNIGDPGWEGMLHKFNHKIIARAHHAFGFSPDERTQEAVLMQEASKLWAAVCADWEESLAHPKARSIVMDTENKTWELLRLARFGRGHQVTQNRYAPVNAEYESFIGLAEASDKNVIFLHREKEEFERKGNYKRQGYGGFEYLPMAQLRTRYVNGDFEATFLDCRHQPELTGMTLTNTNFPEIAGLMLPDVPAPFWEDSPK